MFEDIPKNSRYAYARVSSKSQEDNSSLELQTQEFLKLGVPAVAHGVAIRLWR
mgnify:CR=1 FL=1|jgi:hypothetical protein